jgi:hypothetical protein
MAMLSPHVSCLIPFHIPTCSHRKSQYIHNYISDVLLYQTDGAPCSQSAESLYVLYDVPDVHSTSTYPIFLTRALLL